jgi:GNAT superfamily N-acetyltransferase
MNPSPISWFQRAVEIWRHEGLKHLWFKGLGETVYRRAVLVERRLDASLAEITADAATSIEILSEDEVDDYVDLRPETSLTEIGSRLERNHVCFVARHEGRIVSAAWLATGRVWIDYLACGMELAPDEAYLYESFTAPAFRGRNIPTVRGAYEARYFRDAGYRRLVAVIMPENKPALRHSEKAGWHVFGMIGYVKLGPWRRDFYRGKPGARPPGPIDARA